MGLALLMATTISLLYMGEQPLANIQVRDGHLNPVFLVLII